MTNTKPVIFISYSHKDEPDKPATDEVAWLTFVQSFLAPVVKVGIFDIWVDEHLHGGDVLDPEIKKKLANCDIFVLLTSRHSLASTYVVETEIATMRARKSNGEDVHLFPIVLSPVPNAALRQLKDLVLKPKDGEPLSLMSKNDREIAMAGIADEIAKVAEEIAERKETHKIKAPQPSVQAPEFEPLFLEIKEAFVDTGHLTETAYERLVGRDGELVQLSEAWSDPKINIISLIAEGGAGKSALVNEWLIRMRTDGYRGAETVLGWSFYSQGTKERATSAEQFLNWTVEKLGIKIETTNAAAKGEAIAEAMMKRRVLLLLDGCEPLQHGLNKQQGELKDQGLRALLRRFSATPPGERHGLIVITSRLAVKDVARWQDSAAPVVDVGRLSDEAGAALLRDNKVWGTDKELQMAAHGFGGHALALGLLASFLKETQFGDVRRRDHIRAFFADAENPRHDHAKRVMESYEKEWLAEQPMLLSVMHIVGLFDRPANSDCLKALRAEPAIEGVTNQIVKLDESEWQRTIDRLREVRLLAPLDPAAPGSLDAHPLVREWFGEQLKAKSETAWREAHGRLYEHLRDKTNEGPMPTLEALAPLYQAIAHGCRACRHQEALDEVYVNRICRRAPGNRMEFYASRKLGAVGSDLAALAWFFVIPYEKPVDTLSEADRTWVTGIAAFRLSTLGRYAEGLPATRASFQTIKDRKDWRNAAIAGANLCDAELVVGNVDSAVAQAKHVIAFSDRCDDKFLMTAHRTMYAQTLRVAGRNKQAERIIVKAEKNYANLYPQRPPVHGRAGYNCCCFLLDKREYARARERANQTITIALRNNWLVDMALDALTLGRAHLGLSFANDKLNARADAHIAQIRLDEAVEGLRAAASSVDLPLGHLARAVFLRHVGDWNGATRDLDEVEEIAEPGPMRLFLCDMALERARLAFAKIEAFAPLNELIDSIAPKPTVPDADDADRLKEKAMMQLAIATDYIKTCGYHCRDEELAELEAVLRGKCKFADLSPRV